MAAWSLYGVFVGTRWAMTTNKQLALKTAKEQGGYVTRMPYRDAASSWDAPTFRICSDMVADFRTTETQGG